jgi:exonuclease SbcD
VKLFHISDLHIGKKFRETDFLPEQIYILDQIVEAVDNEKPDGILIAGDIYDRSVPPANAVHVFDDFLTKLSKRNVHIFIISGNHDSPERLNFAKELLGKHKVYIGGTFQGELDKIELSDEHGKVNIYLMPFIKPSMVLNYKKDVEISTYEEAAKIVIDDSNINTVERNILVAHQFVTNGGVEPEKSESEIVSIGGLDNIDVSVFHPFDYVALGHIHGPQKIGRDTIRYCGTPLKYSFSECNHKKSITCIHMKEKGDIEISLIPLVPRKDLRVIKDTLHNLLTLEKYTSLNNEDYIKAIITDEDDVFDPIGKLRTKYPNVLLLEVENAKSSMSEYAASLPKGEVASRNPMDLFTEFYFNQNNVEINENQINILLNIFEEMGEKD